MVDIDALDREHTLSTAVRRYEDLRTRDSLADPDEPAGPRPLGRAEALELLALGEVVSRKAHDSQLIGIRAALRGGASWEQIAEALGVPADFARKCFTEAIAERLDAAAAAAACDLAGARPVR